MAGRARRRAAWRSMVGRVKSLGSQGRRVRYRKNERKRALKVESPCEE